MVAFCSKGSILLKQFDTKTELKRSLLKKKKRKEKQDGVENTENDPNQMCQLLLV